MPPYIGNGAAGFLRNNNLVYLWQNETVSVGGLSQSFVLERINRSFYPWGLSFEVSFSGAPGTFEIDLLGANQDIGLPIPGNYNYLGAITQVNSQNVGRWDMPSQMWPRYVAGYVKTLTNAVKMTLTVTK
jgi:hypothetical protein